MIPLNYLKCIEHISYGTAFIQSCPVHVGSFPLLLLSLATLVLYHQFLVPPSFLAVAFGVLNPTTPHFPPFVRSVLRQVAESPTDCVFCLYDVASSTDLIPVVVFSYLLPLVPNESCLVPFFTVNTAGETLTVKILLKKVI